MTYVVTDMAEAQAMGLCWIARQPGLPDIPTLRAAASYLHAAECGYCSYPLAELLRMVEDREITEADEKRWENLPAKVKGRAIAMIQGGSK